MRRPLVRAAVLLLLAFALWLPSRLGTTRPDASRDLAAPTASPAKGPRPERRPAASGASGPVFQIADGPGAPRSYVVALDELYLPTHPSGRRLVAIPAQADLDRLLAHAATLAPGAGGDAPRLVLYPDGAERNSATRRILDPRVDVKLASAATPTPAPLPGVGITAWERPAYAPDHALGRVTGDPARPLLAARAAASLAGVVSARPLLARQHFPKFVPNDPLFADQWHLRNTGQQSGKAGVDISAVPAWDSATGVGVVVGIVDDGVEYTHPDLAAGYNASLSHDWNDNDSNPYPVKNGLEGDNHGTCVTGLVAARGDNGVGVSGVAPAAQFAGLRLISDETDDATDAEAMAWKNDSIAIKSNSWGPPDANAYYGIYPGLYPAGTLWADAIATAVASGRGGLGTLFFWASGNGQDGGDQGTLDGYASDRHVIAIGAATNTGAIATFSEGGPHLVAAAPGDAKLGIVTTDRAGNNGYNSYADPEFAGDYTTTFDYTRGFAGTSAATPVASGVGALLLEARPDLGWRDVKEILLRSSTKLLPTDANWVSRPAGDAAHPIKHHPRLGGGLINALAALTLARDWTPLAAETSVNGTAALSLPVSIPDAGGAAVTTTFTLPNDAPLLRVEHVVLTLDITHPYRGDLEITLTSPSGVVSRFTSSNRYMDPAEAADYPSYPFSSVRHWGEASALPSSPSARWTLTVRDVLARDTGTLNAASLTLYGVPLAAPALVDAPENQTLATGSTLVLGARFSGANLAYSWTLNGKTISGANAAEYRVAPFSASAAGAYVCTAANELGSASANATVTLDDSSRATVDVRVGADATLDLADYVSGDILAWSATGLPAGLSLDGSTGLVSGRATKPGAYRVVVSATTADGLVVKTPLSLVVAPVPDAVAGNYVALVARSSALNADLGGALAITIAPTGIATGRLTLGRSSYSFTGLVASLPENQLHLDANVPKAGVRLGLDFAAFDSGTTVSGVVFSAADAQTNAIVSGSLSPWNTTTRPATTYASANVYALVPATDTSTQLGAAAATVRVGSDGRVSWQITPSDGAKAITGSTLLTDDARVLVHAPYATSLGSLRGVLVVPDSGAPTQVSGSAVDWLRKPAATLALPDGFGPLDLVPANGGGRYTPPAAGARILGLNAGTPGVDLLTAPSYADLASAASVGAGISVDASNRFIVAAPNTAKVKLGFASTTGLITGGFVADGLTAKANAVVLPGATQALGFAFLPPAPGSSAYRSQMLIVQPAAAP